ncbi:MAG: hypothetical protein HY814_00390 [Candidatus Riflebacteria bacterium]|nr:hypothetical protein [Candidatus Riflebacteria bacterium]
MIVLYVLALITVASFLALAIDVSYFYARKAQVQTVSDAAALAALGAAGSHGSGQGQTEQDARVGGVVGYHAVANGLSSGYWTQVIAHNADGDVNQVILNRSLGVNTLFSNLVNQRSVTIGIQSVAARTFLSNQINQSTMAGGINFFGCVRLEMLGNPVVRSRDYDSWAVGDSVRAGSNFDVEVQGSVVFGGDLTCASLINFVGGASVFDGTYQAPVIVGSPGSGTNTRIQAPYPQMVVAAAVMGATASSNNNNLVLGCTAAFRNRTSFVLEKTGSPGTISIPAGAKIYAREVNLHSDELVITGNPNPPPVGAGPVTITLDASTGNGTWFSDRDVSATVSGGMKPKYLKIIGISPPSVCCAACPPGPEIEFNHHVMKALVYAPGFVVDFQSNPTFHGSIVADILHVQGSPEVFGDEDNGFAFNAGPGPTGTAGKPRLTN